MMPAAAPFDPAFATARRLIALQGRDGLWGGFRMTPGESREWVGAVAALALAGAAASGRLPPALSALARRRALRAAARLRGSERPGGGWGYNAAVPPDADSTAAALRLFAALGQVPPAASVDFLRALGSPETGWATYGPMRVWDAWSRPCPEVDAAAALALAGAGALTRADLAAAWRRLAPAQGADGHWPAYWWPGPGVATLAAIQLWDGAGRPDPRPLVPAPAGPGMAALDALTLAQAGGMLDARAGMRAVAAACARMAGCGRWPADAVLLAPPRYPASPPGTGEASPEGRGALTAAAALTALTALHHPLHLHLHLHLPLPARSRHGPAATLGSDPDLAPAAAILASHDSAAMPAPSPHASSPRHRGPASPRAADPEPSPAARTWTDHAGAASPLPPPVPRRHDPAATPGAGPDPSPAAAAALIGRAGATSPMPSAAVPPPPHRKPASSFGPGPSPAAAMPINQAPTTLPAPPVIAGPDPSPAATKPPDRTGAPLPAPPLAVGLGALAGDLGLSPAAARLADRAGAALLAPLLAAPLPWPNRAVSNLARGWPVEFSATLDPARRPALRLAADLGDPRLSPAARARVARASLTGAARVLGLDPAPLGAGLAPLLAAARHAAPDERFTLWAGLDLTDGAAGPEPILKAYANLALAGPAAAERLALAARIVTAAGGADPLPDLLALDAALQGAGHPQQMGLALTPRGLVAAKVYWELPAYDPAATARLAQAVGLAPHPAPTPEIPGLASRADAGRGLSGLAVRLDRAKGLRPELTLATQAARAVTWRSAHETAALAEWAAGMGLCASAADALIRALRAAGPAPRSLHTLTLTAGGRLRAAVYLHADGWLGRYLAPPARQPAPPPHHRPSRPAFAAPNQGG